jgi:hypothetical protein
LVAETCGIVHPLPLESRSIGMTPAQVMRVTQRHDFLIVEPHPVEDVSDVVGTLCHIRQTSTWKESRVVDEVGTSCLLISLGPVDGFDCDAAGEHPEGRCMLSTGWQPSGSLHRLKEDVCMLRDLHSLGPLLLLRSACPRRWSRRC